MKKIILAASLIAAVALSGCGSSATSSSDAVEKYGSDTLK